MFRPIGFFLLLVVSGYDMSPMAEGVYDEAVMEVVGGDTVLTDAALIKVCPSNLTTLQPFSQLSFIGYQSSQSNPTKPLFLHPLHCNGHLRAPHSRTRLPPLFRRLHHHRRRASWARHSCARRGSRPAVPMTSPAPGTTFFGSARKFRFISCRRTM